MENYAEDKSNKAEDRAKVRGYLTQLKKHKMVLYMGFVKDVLNEVAKISLLFQREDITVYSAVTKLQSAQTSLRGLIDNDGPSVTEIKAQIWEGKFHDFQLLNLLPDDTLANDRHRITQSVLDCMSSRLENLTTDDIFLAWNAFDHKNWPLATERVKIIHLTSVLPLANASCERAFSTMKRIKSDWRCKIGSEVLDILMRIKIADVQLRAFDPKPAVTRWWLSGQRQKRPNNLPYGPRN